MRTSKIASILSIAITACCLIIPVASAAAAPYTITEHGENNAYIKITPGPRKWNAVVQKWCGSAAVTLRGANYYWAVDSRYGMLRNGYGSGSQTIVVLNKFAWEVQAFGSVTSQGSWDMDTSHYLSSCRNRP